MVKIKKSSSNKMPKRNRIFSKAFSLIEVSIVLLIIGVLIAATISAKALIKNSRIASAQAKTRSAPINSIPNATIWLESSLESSFSASEAEDGTPLTGWNDIKSSSSQDVNDASGGGTAPTYSNTINSIQAVKFDSTKNTFLNINGANLNNSDYTIFILEKRQSSGSNYFLGDPETLSGGSSAANEDETLVLGYSDGGTVIHSQGGTNSYTSSVDAYSSSNENPRIFTFIQNSSTGKKTYINGYLAGEDADTSKLTNITTLSLGKGYTGEIGEFVVFNRALKNEERQSTEKYLQEKWRMSINSISTTAESCTSGETTSTSGCDMSNTPCSLSATGISATGLSPTSSADEACNATHFDTSVNITYSCIDGNSTILSGTCTCALGYEGSDCNTCIDGYTDDGSGGCEPSAACTTDLPITGSTVTSVDHGDTAGIACNATNYTGTSTGYSCDNDNFTAGTACACATGYDIANNCTTCLAGYSDTDSGSAVVCEQDCSIADGTPGIKDLTTVKFGSISYDCDETDYTGTITYSCSSPGAEISISSNDCVPPPLTCTGGTITYIDTDADSVNDRKVHLFASNGTFACSSGPSTNDLDYLIVGSGGNGGSGSRYEDTTYGYVLRSAGGGGGGSGQIMEFNDQLLQAGDSLSLIVGLGKNTQLSGKIGGVDLASAIIAGKGGKGGNGNSNGNGSNGSSGELGSNGGRAGGGGGGGYDGSGTTGGSPGSGQGSAKSGGKSNGGNGGGYGASSGLGVFKTITGTSIKYASGGRGGTDSSSYGSSYNATLYGYGGQGGGGGSTSQSPASAKGGVVIFSYPYP